MMPLIYYGKLAVKYLIPLGFTLLNLIFINCEPALQASALGFALALGSTTNIMQVQIFDKFMQTFINKV